MLWLDKLDDSIFPDTDNYFELYIDYLLKHDLFEPNTEVFTRFHREGWGGLGYQEYENPIFQKIYDRLKEAVSEALAHKLKQEAQALLNRLHADSGAETLLYDFGLSDGNYGGVPILHNIPAEDFADILVQDGKFNSTIAAALNRRYEYWQSHPELAEEKIWLFELERTVRSRALAATPPFRKLLTERIDNWFGEIIRNIGSGCAVNSNQPTV